MWNPVSPNIGMNSSEMIPMTTILHKQELNFVHMTLMELLPYNCVELGQLFSAVQHYDEAKRKDAHHVNAE
jgi:hypothetical protein